MNGAESLVQTLLASGVDTCFANPGTSEMHFVAALDREPRMRCVLALFEGVATGAADGYARVTGKPAAVLLHCAPGLGNGLANLHNAKRGNVPVINIVGDHATYHSQYDPPLHGDTAGWASGVSIWTRTSMRAADVGRDAAEAVCRSQTGAGGVATLILPSNSSWDEGGSVAAPLPVPERQLPTEQSIADVGALLQREGSDVLLVLGGSALLRDGLDHAARICAATGATMMGDTFASIAERGAGRQAIERVPYPVDQAVALYAKFRRIVLVGADRPVAFFAYPDKPSLLTPPDSTVQVLAAPHEDAAGALAALADLIGAAPHAPPPAAHTAIDLPNGAPSPTKLAQALATLLPENSIVVDESVTMTRTLYAGTAEARPHVWLQLTGGAIGDGVPMATGAGVGGGGRRVVNLQADGSALYTLQGLWTQARERAPVTTVILNNRKYSILLHELVAVGANPGPVATSMMSLDDPGMDWVSLAQGFGVEAARATTMEQCADLLATSFRQDGPFLIELMLG